MAEVLPTPAPELSAGPPTAHGHTSRTTRPPRAPARQLELAGCVWPQSAPRTDVCGPLAHVAVSVTITLPALSPKMA